MQEYAELYNIMQLQLFQRLLIPESAGKFFCIMKINQTPEAKNNKRNTNAQNNFQSDPMPSLKSPISQSGYNTDLHNTS